MIQPGKTSDVFHRAGQCFWLSRNGHGTGFFDEKMWKQKTRDKLQEAASAFVEVSYFVASIDGKIEEM